MKPITKANIQHDLWQGKKVAANHFLASNLIVSKGVFRMKEIKEKFRTRIIIENWTFEFNDRIKFYQNEMNYKIDEIERESWIWFLSVCLCNCFFDCFEHLTICVQLFCECVI